MARALLSRIETRENVFERWREDDGRVVYYKNGVITTRQSFAAALPHAIDVETPATLEVDSADPVPIQRDIVRNLPNGAIQAGPDAALVGVRPGKFLSKKEAAQLRAFQGRRRNFHAFASLDSNAGRPRSEQKQRYFEFLREVEEARSMGIDEYYDVMDRWEWPGYEETPA